MIDTPLHKRRKKETKKSSTKLQTEAEREREIANFSSYKNKNKNKTKQDWVCVTKLTTQQQLQNGFSEKKTDTCEKV
jgi:hypothetical protein